MFKHLIFYLSLNRIGPDMILTHWILYSRRLTKLIYQKRFYRFDDTAEIRPGSYFLNISTISLGKNVVIRPGSFIAGEAKERTKGKASIVIEDNALISPGVHVYPSNHAYADFKKPIMDQGDSPFKLVRIKGGSWLGANVIILPGVVVGRNAVVGAGAVLTKSIPDYSIAVLLPPKVVRYK